MIFLLSKQQIRFFLPTVTDDGMLDVAGRSAWLANMAALGAQGGSSGEPPQTADHHGTAAIANLQPLPAAVSASPAAIPAVDNSDETSKSPEPRVFGLKIGYVFMTYYVCMTYMYTYTYTYTYIHTFIYICTYSINIHT